MELSADPAATWTAGVGMPEWSSTANGVNTKITAKGFTFPVGALVGSLDGGTTFFLVGTQLKLPVQTAGTLQLYFWDADAANNGGAIQVTVKVSIPDQVRSIDDYFLTLPSWASKYPLSGDSEGPTGSTGQPDKSVVLPNPGTESKQERYSCTTTPYSLTKTPDKIVTFNPDMGKLWLGGLLQGTGYSNGLGSLAELPIRQRAPLKIYLER